MKLKKLLENNYIPANNHWKETYSRLSEKDDLWDYIPIDKIHVRKIKINKSLLDYPNDVNENDVTYMINNFYEDAWDPIVVNKDYFILDGQHRLQLAKRVGLKYIDVIMKKKKSPGISKKIREQFKREYNYQKEIKKILGFAI